MVMVVVAINDANACAASHCTHRWLCEKSLLPPLLLRIFALKPNIRQLIRANKSSSFVVEIATAKNKTLTNWHVPWVFPWEMATPKIYDYVFDVRAYTHSLWINHEFRLCMFCYAVSLNHIKRNRLYYCHVGSCAAVKSFEPSRI